MGMNGDGTILCSFFKIRFIISYPGELQLRLDVILTFSSAVLRLASFANFDLSNRNSVDSKKDARRARDYKNIFVTLHFEEHVIRLFISTKLIRFVTTA